MSNANTDHPLGCADLPIGEVAGMPGARDPVAAFVMRPSSDAEADMLREIDAIQERLRVGIPQLHRELDTLLARVRTPGSF
jgi:hypothetical protein